jgi:STE24 endopeptidase
VLQKYGSGSSLTGVLFAVGQSAVATFVGFLIATGILIGIAKLTRENGKFWIVTTGLLCLLMFLLQLLIPELYFGIYGEDNFAQVEESRISASAKDEIEQLVQRTGFPYQEVYIQLADEGPNAAYIGFMDGRVVIFQSLVDLLSPSDLCGPVAHELGHWKHRDSVKVMFAVFLLLAGLGLAIRHLSRGGLRAFGFEDGPVYAIIWMAIVTADAFELVELPLFNALKRFEEYGADCFAAQLNSPIGNALVQLTETVSREIESSWAYEAFYLDHPQLSRRLRHISTCARG